MSTIKTTIVESFDEDTDLILRSANSEGGNITLLANGAVRFEGASVLGVEVVQGLPAKEYFSCYDTTGGVNLNSVATIVLDTVFKNSNGSVFSLSDGNVTINKTGTYMVHMDVSTDTSSGSGRSDSNGYLEQNFSEVLGSRVSMYNRLAGVGENTGSATFILDVTNGDVFRVRGLRTSGSDTIISKDDGTRLTFLEL